MWKVIGITSLPVYTIAPFLTAPIEGRGSAWSWVRLGVVLGFLLAFGVGIGGWEPAPSKPLALAQGEKERFNLLQITKRPGECIPPPAGLIAWWPMDDQPGSTTVIDLTGTHNAIPSTSITTFIGGQFISAVPNTLSPPPLVVPQVPGPTGYGALFFVGHYLEVPHHPDLNIGPDGLTLEGWTKTTGSQPLIDKFDPTTNSGYGLYLKQVSPPATFALVLNLNGTVFTSTGTFTSAIPVQPVDWHLVAVTIRPATPTSPGNVRFFIDGAPAGNFNHSFTAAVLANSVPLLIAATRLTAAPGFPCATHPALLCGGELALDEVEIFKRALSQQEIQAIYEAGSAGKCKEVQPPPPPQGECDLTVHKKVLKRDDTVLFEVVVLNVGDGVCEPEIVVRDEGLFGLTFLNVQALPPWTCSPFASGVECVYPDPLGPGQGTSFLVELGIELPEEFPEACFVNCVSVKGPNDVNSDNNRDCACDRACRS